jgi:hypothetical protein
VLWNLSLFFVSYEMTDHLSNARALLRDELPERFSQGEYLLGKAGKLPFSGPLALQNRGTN